MEARQVPGIIWILILLLAGYFMQTLLPDFQYTPAVLGGIGLVISALKVYLTVEEKKIIEELDVFNVSTTEGPMKLKVKEKSIISKTLIG